ncbi:MAG: TetR/AcrR family transcriptional regulator [Micrococcales bacterium]|nr:TetR/AcrR family transcriptional regulator [Micrococcales bacterium]
MARTVDPRRYAAKRTAIIDAGLTCMSRDGYDRSTTAAVCREAGIGSGTFFHYFPTKLSLLLAILELGTREQEEWFEAQRDRTDAADVVRDYVAWTASEYADPRAAGFVRAVAAVTGEPEVQAALDRDTSVARAGLRHWLTRAGESGEIRTDVGQAQLADWLLVILDGFLGRVAADENFSAEGESGMLTETVQRLLAPGPPRS